ncbi:hypothetical protein [Kordiimonas aquimaris]|uniref:hypothetical protein n=1 Tax=Kordiimonas aquimaris TaxID=707591 RepID=UPI0021CE0B67|nr:hypothetical protein [Kordiimonas aquimaris]
MNNSGKYLQSRLSNISRILPRIAVAATLLTGSGTILLSGSDAALAEAPPGGRIGYVLTNRMYAVYETDESVQCPDGLNLGPRELFAKRFPDDGTKRTVVETQLKLEGENWHSNAEENLVAPYREPQGNISYGLNLDGQTGPNDFQSPDGEDGIDNQFYRVVGCTNNYMKAGSLRHFVNVFMVQYNSNRWVFELTGVDDLTNDDEVTLTTYRGRDPLLADATGEGYIPGGTQRIDMRWGKEFIMQIQGKIVDGILTTEPIEHIKVPASSTFNTNGYESYLGLRFQLALTPKAAKGTMAGFMDIDKFRHWRNTTWSTHHQSYGQESASSMYSALHRHADGYPDAVTGQNTAISMAQEVTFVQTYIMHPSEKTNQVAAASLN